MSMGVHFIITSTLHSLVKVRVAVEHPKSVYPKEKRASSKLVEQIIYTRYRRDKKNLWKPARQETLGQPRSRMTPPNANI